MIKQAAFVRPNPMLKGALHCHTTRSDGKGAPEVVVRKHVEHGYAFLAITDHRLYNHKNFAPDTDIIIVPGAEIDRSIPGRGGVHCFHAVTIGPSLADGSVYQQDHVFAHGEAYDQFEFQKVLDALHADGNMTFYCHPEWSATPAREFERLSGNFAMEIWNTGCAQGHNLDTNAAYWDELLMQNIRIFGVATDDGHGMDQHCVGWVMVNAERELNAILAALRDGAFYSSCGPTIHDFYIDGGTAVLECSPCALAEFRYGRYPTRIIKNPDGLITRAEFAIPPYFTYLRASVKDAEGRRAWTNPIFID